MRRTMKRALARSGGASSRDTGDRPGNDVLGLVAAIVAILFLLVVLDRGLRVPPPPSADSRALVVGARAASECLDAGTWSGCGAIEHSRMTAVYPYPLLQYLPAVALVRLGQSDEQIIRWLERLSALAFLGSTALVVFVAHRVFRPGWAPILALTMLTGYGLY